MGVLLYFFNIMYWSEIIFVIFKVNNMFFWVNRFNIMFVYYKIVMIFKEMFIKLC